MNLKAIEKASQIQLVILDVDGVLTDGRLYMDNQGNPFKAFNAKDGLGMRLLQNASIDLAIMTGKQSDVVTHRAKELDVKYVYQNCKPKLPYFEKLIEESNIAPKHTAYIGDDLIDLPIMRRVGLSVAVADAHDDVLAVADFVTKRTGGKGAVRELADMILKAQDKYDEVTAIFRQ